MVKSKSKDKNTTQDKNLQSWIGSPGRIPIVLL